MAVETVLGLSEQFAVEALFTHPDLSPATRRLPLRLVSKAKATLHSPPAAPNRNSFIFAWREPFRVSDARPPQLRPELLEQTGQSQSLRSYIFVQREELRLEFIADLNAPFHLSI
jgi:hypothetical protein